MNLNKWFLDKEDIFKYFTRKGVVLDQDDKKKRRVFIDNGGKILLVAHLDTVLKPVIHKQDDKRIYAQGLDDRLGCYLAIGLSKCMSADVLLTDNEETAATTAQYHKLKKYNWICELDRAGMDFVTYGLSSKPLNKALTEYWKEGYGSFSDISWLMTDTACFNLGIGYNHAHSKDSYCAIKDVESQVTKFKAFYDKYQDVSFVQDGTPEKGCISWAKKSTKAIQRSYCDKCGGNGGEYVHGWFICEDCITEAITGNKVEKVKCGCCESMGSETTYDPMSDMYLCCDCKEYHEQFHYGV